jgi:hypothetical protein
MWRVGFIGFFLAALVTAAPVEQSLSPSRQFIVYGTDVAMRGVLCDLAEQTKRELLTLLEERDNWTTAIVINAQYPQANLPELPRLRVDVGQTGFGLKLQLDLVVNSQTRSPEIRRELLRALILERMYRGRANIPAGTAYTSPPDWLLDGIPDQQTDLTRARLASLLALPVTAKNVLPLEKFLGQRPDLLDAAGRSFYRAYSFALVDLLSHLPDGSHRLTRFIADLPVASNDPMVELRNHFAELSETGAPEKMWAEQIAKLSTEQPYQLMGPAETEKILAEKLRIRISERGIEKHYELEEFAAYLKSKSAKNGLGVMAADLSSLATRANPLYASILADYLEITARLSRGRTLGLAGRLERLRTLRRDLTAQMREIDDYLNWFEATNLAQPSGDFADYMRAAERSLQPERPRRDPISVYVTAVETEFEK